jgi:hypothetical protein
MLDQMYLLNRPTVAVKRGVADHACQILPAGSILVVESGREADKAVNVRCGDQELWMFAVDLGERTDLLLAIQEQLVEPSRRRAAA